MEIIRSNICIRQIFIKTNRLLYSTVNIPKRDYEPMTPEEKINKQVDKWDLYAKLAPTCFLVVATLLISTGVIDFKMAFYVGIGIFAGTAVTWWFWTIYTIKHLVKILNRATKNLENVKGEFVLIADDIKEYKRDTE
tara:strand:- start:827 stop:1237 length:411 start_codon:yes stop_codon:yes gene_type:complete